MVSDAIEISAAVSDDDAGGAGATWDQATLRSACRLLAEASATQVTRVSLEGRAPARAGGALMVLQLAERVAEEYGCRALLAIRAGTIVVTFARRPATAAPRSRDDR
jgi:hypothetical protein